MTVLLLLGVSLVVTAQRSEVISAYNYNEEREFEKAMIAIDEASEHEKTREDAKTWYYRGNIYYNIAVSKEEKHSRLHENPVSVAIDSYLKAKKLDNKGKYTEEIDQRLVNCRTLILNRGVRFHNQRNYTIALKAFDQAIRVGKSLGMGGDTLAYYNGALAASQIGKTDKAIEYFRKCIELNYRGADIYNLLINLYNQKGKPEKAYEVIREGRNAYPENKNLIINELNYYLQKQNFDKARKNLELAIEKDKDNPLLYFSLGTVYDNLYSDSDTMPDEIGGKDRSLFRRAKENYEKAIELDPSYFDPWYNLGAMYYNRGVEVVEKASTIKGQSKYDEELEKAREDFRKALPRLEKALQLKPDDQSTLVSLKQLYARLDMDEKYEEVKKKLKQ